MGYKDLLQEAFFNIDDDQRSQMFAMVDQVDDTLKDYLVFKGLAVESSPKLANG